MSIDEAYPRFEAAVNAASVVSRIDTTEGLLDRDALDTGGAQLWQDQVAVVHPVLHPRPLSPALSCLPVPLVSSFIFSSL